MKTLSMQAWPWNRATRLCSALRSAGSNQSLRVPVCIYIYVLILALDLRGTGIFQTGRKSLEFFWSFGSKYLNQADVQSVRLPGCGFHIVLSVEHPPTAIIRSNQDVGFVHKKKRKKRKENKKESLSEKNPAKQGKQF